jgi:hypothetical protein
MKKKLNIIMRLSFVAVLCTIMILAAGCGKEVPMYQNPLTGEMSETEWPARPLQVSIDNVGDAYPQSWLSKADLVYEFPVEGNQTRLQAIYYGEFPEEFGPIRSTRPYFVDLAREYKAIFLAHGWSPQAKSYLLSDVVPYINAMNSDCEFYRVDDKSSPHDSYIKWETVKAKIDEKGWWAEKQEIRPFVFLEEDAVNTGDSVKKIEFDYLYSEFEFTYDEEIGKYKRTSDGAEFIDMETQEVITADNVLVQFVKSSVIDSKGRLKIDMCAGGDAILFTKGGIVKGTWARENLDSRTIFTDAEGNEFQFSVGNTWVEVVDQTCEMDYDVIKAEKEE